MIRYLNIIILRIIEMEESKRALEDSQNASFNGNDTLNGDSGNPPSVDSMQPPPTPATPDYAAGLTALNPPTPSVVITNNRSPIHTPSQAPSTPYTQPVTPYFQPTSVLQSPRTPKTPTYTAVIMDNPGKSFGNFSAWLEYHSKAIYSILQWSKKKNPS